MKFTFDELVKQEVINLDQKKLDDDDFEAIKNVLQASKHAAVKELRLSGTNNITLADGKFTNALANNNTLGTLSISHNNIGVEGQSIWQLHLQRIRLWRCLGSAYPACDISASAQPLTMSSISIFVSGAS